MYERLILMKELLTEDGSIFVHLDWHVGHYVKVMMDEVFGYENFRNEIIVKRGRKKSLQYQFEEADRMHVGNDVILWFSKNLNQKFPILMKKVNEENGKWMGFWSNVNRPTMRYELLGVKLSRGQWKWNKERALKAVKNYEEYLRNYANKMSLEEYWKITGKQLEFIRKRPEVKYPEYWIPPKEEKIIDNIWLDIESYDYSTGFNTEKHEELLTRIIENFSNSGDLVADFFCGSGTTLTVAEKLGRRWVGCDLSKFAIHITRKRLMDIHNSKDLMDESGRKLYGKPARPFEIWNIGNYETVYWRERIDEYLAFMLKLYQAQPLVGFKYIHGKKGNRMVHIGPLNAPVTMEEVEKVVLECRDNGFNKADVLGWDWAYEVNDLAKEMAKRNGVELRLIQIPSLNELKSALVGFDLKLLKIPDQVVEKELLPQVKFYEVAYLELDAKVKGRALTLAITDFQIPPSRGLSEIKDKIRSFVDLIDYWAVDWDYKGDVFHNQWQSFRTRKEPSVELEARHEYSEPGNYLIMVKVVDVFGADMNKILDVKVK